MADTLQLEIVTPERLVVNETTEEIQVPGKSGYLGILPGHAPLITELAIGEIGYRTGSEVKRLAVAWGFAEVLPGKVTILAETAERAEEIDVARAQASRQRAEDELRKAGPDGNPEAEAALARANVRLEVVRKLNAQLAQLTP
ncbi:MAG TPA: F0F1 ATP synthase subunit epsilon [Candidatus Angelobacter sp.]|jgi:F-type H+-transporting ATPase subunit epsilon|nr:F0F1 ATP synthase subunit epsilon [Candidatus Angelobacter sp.]